MGRRRSEDGPPEMPEDQKQDYDRYSERLRRVNGEAADLLISLFHVCSDAQQSLWCCRQLRAKLEQMKVWLSACEEIIAHVSDWHPHAVEYVFRRPSPCKLASRRRNQQKARCEASNLPRRKSIKERRSHQKPLSIPVGAGKWICSLG